MFNPPRLHRGRGLRCAIASLPLTLCLGAGCMLTPSNGTVVADRNTPIWFSGYHLYANQPVQVRGYNRVTNTWMNLGSPANSSAEPLLPGFFDDPLFEWGGYRLLPLEAWLAGPNGGFCAAVEAHTTMSGNTYDLTTVESDWAECLPENTNAAAFADNCGSEETHVNLYTSDWAPMTVTGQDLDILALLMENGLLGIKLDNFTPTAYQFCSAATPGGCPNPADPQPLTFKFYQPLGSVINGDGQPFPFSINPTRVDPYTIYVDDIYANGYDIDVVGDEVVLDIDFEEQGTELRFDCVDNAFCALLQGLGTILDFDGELVDPRAQLSLSLGVENGDIAVSHIDVSITAVVPPVLEAYLPNVEESVEQILNSAGVRSQLNEFLDVQLRQTLGIPSNFPIRSVETSGDDLVVEIGCPQPTFP